MERLREADRYKDIYGADPAPLLDTDWMSDIVSDLDTDNEVEKRVHKARVYATASFSQAQIDAGAKVFEKITKMFRSQEVSITANCRLEAYIFVYETVESSLRSSR